MLENLLIKGSDFGRQEHLLEVIRLSSGAERIPLNDFHNLGIPRGAIDLLVAISILKFEDNYLILRKRPVGDDIKSLIITSLFTQMKQENMLHGIFNFQSVSYDADEKKIIVSNPAIPIRFSKIKNTLINLGFLMKNKATVNQFIINPDYQEWFLSDIVSDIDAAQIGNNPVEKLRKQLENHENLGREAEKFVLAYEKSVRANHPKVANISIVSDKDTSAGFDILSYSSDDAVMLDKFIEVKSYVGEPRFYWSANEVKVAKEKGNRYYLYLVDRRKIGMPGYEPTQIVNPHDSLFIDSNWLFESDGYFFKKNNQ